MKKFLAILLAMMLVMVSVAAMAEDEELDLPIMNGTHVESDESENESYIDGATGMIVLTKKYDMNGASGVTNHPADTLQFQVAWNGAEDTGVDFKEADWSSNLPTIEKVTVSEDDDPYIFKVKLPTYTTYGVFKYKITEVDTKVAGMTYNYTGETETDTSKKTLYLRVGVAKMANATSESNVEIQYIAIRTVDGNSSTVKTDEIVNKYEAGQLTISKNVTGNLGDKSKVFNFKVTFETTNEEVVKSTISFDGTGTLDTAAEITVSDDGQPSGLKNGKILPGTDGWTEKIVYVGLTDKQNMVFTNIPEGVTYTIEETNYTGEGYDAVVEDYSNADKEIKANAKDTATFTNNKEITPDTGIALETLPYVLMMALAMMGLVALKLRKREEY